jgi:hypothetical protein
LKAARPIDSDNLHMLKRLTTAAVTGALMLPAAGAAVAAADTPPQRDGGDRYELKARQAGALKQGVPAAEAVEDACDALGRRYTSLQCRTFQTELGADGVLECIGSTRAKKALTKKIRRMIRNDEIIRPEAAGYYVGVWSQGSQRVVRIDWARWGHLGTPI